MALRTQADGSRVKEHDVCDRTAGQVVRWRHPYESSMHFARQGGHGMKLNESRMQNRAHGAKNDRLEQQFKFRTTENAE